MDKSEGKYAAESLRVDSKQTPRKRISRLLAVVVTIASAIISACSSKPLSPYTADTPPLILVPALHAGVQDKRGRFREIFCQVLEARGAALPDYRPCEEALTRVGLEPAGSGERVELGLSQRRLVAVVVPGIGWDCFSAWLEPKGTVATHLRQFDYDLTILEVDSLSSSANNARQIRDAIMQIQSQDTKPQLVLIGYSKGAPDILEAVVAYPEIRSRVAAVISVAGAIGGSPLANNAKESDLALLRKWPGARCSSGDGGAIKSLRPATRKDWLAQNSLPRDFPYYSLVTFPDPENISSVLTRSYNKLSRIDARNDSQVLFFDQVIPGSALVGYLNADHWALAVPVARSHSMISSIFVDQNDYPREALAEALLRFVEEDLPMLGK